MDKEYKLGSFNIDGFDIAPYLNSNKTMNDNYEELTNRVNELEEDNHKLQEEVDECKKDILKIQEVTQRIYNELQSAWDQIDKLKKNNKSEDDY